MPSSTASVPPAVLPSQAFATSSDSVSLWEEPHPGRRRPYPLAVGLGLADGATHDGCVNGMAAERPGTRTRVRPFLPRCTAQHHEASSKPSVAPRNMNVACTDSSPPSTELKVDASVSICFDQMPEAVFGFQGPPSMPTGVFESPRQPPVHAPPLDAPTISISTEPPQAHSLDCDGDTQISAEHYDPCGQLVLRHDVYGWDAELERQLHAGRRPVIHTDNPCGCDVDYNHRKATGMKRGLLHRVFSLRSSSDSMGVKTRRATGFSS